MNFKMSLRLIADVQESPREGYGHRGEMDSGRAYGSADCTFAFMSMDSRRKGDKPSRVVVLVCP